MSSGGLMVGTPRMVQVPPVQPSPHPEVEVSPLTNCYIIYYLMDVFVYYTVNLSAHLDFD